MELKNNYVGQINIRSGKVDVTDPCYNKGAWCRTTLDVAPGVYDCFAFTGKDKHFGDRIWIATILLNGEETDDISIVDNSEWEQVSVIGVDAGLAGFFENKPDFSKEEWFKLCDWMFDKSIEHNSEGKKINAYIKDFSSGDGFWTESGLGDGNYEVFAIKRNNKIVALEIRF